MTSCVSLAELAAAGIPLRPAEAVSVVAELCRQHAAGEIPGMPSPGIIRVTRDGQVLARGPMTTEEVSVSRAGQLLDDLLPGADAPADYRPRGGLRLVLARAFGTLDLPPYASLDEFRAALARFAGPDPVATACGLFRRWEDRQGTSEPAVAAPASALTISDIRRARRATGWSLDDLSDLADVPLARLRELEWGYVRNWRADDEARDRVRRYARAAGLDEQLVLSIAWPLVVEGAAATVNDEHEPAPVTALVRSGPQGIATIESPARRRTRPGWISAAFAKASAARSALAIAVAALLALATFAIVMGSAKSVNSQPRMSNSQPPAVSSQGTGPVREARVETSTALATPAPVSKATARPRSRPAPSRPAARPRSFFKRELFRIVIK